MKMTKLLSIITYIVILTGCDKEMFYDYVIQNNHNKTIIVEFETDETAFESISIEPGIIDTIYVFTIIEGTKIYEREIIFNQISIKSDTIESTVDYLSNESWEYIKKSDTHAVYYLTVNNDDFE